MPAPQTSTLFGAQIPRFPTFKFVPFQKPILRRRQRPFRAAASDGPYRLPKAISDCLEASLAAFRNAEGAYALAVFLGRFWSAPNRLGMPFPIDRRALAQHHTLDLSEGEIRGALKTLERVGFLNRAVSGKGSLYRPTAEGLHRKPILFAFAEDFAAAFRSANQKAKRNLERDPAQAHLRPRPTPCQKAPVFKSPKNKIALGKELLMGQLPTPNRGGETALEKSLASLAQALGLPVPRKAHVDEV